jgi:ribosomal protein L12E/L44/L45/RPP1/RPP2
MERPILPLFCVLWVLSVVAPAVAVVPYPEEAIVQPAKKTEPAPAESSRVRSTIEKLEKDERRLRELLKDLEKHAHSAKASAPSGSDRVRAAVQQLEEDAQRLEEVLRGLKGADRDNGGGAVK